MEFKKHDENGFPNYVTLPIEEYERLKRIEEKLSDMSKTDHRTEVEKRTK